MTEALRHVGLGGWLHDHEDEDWAPSYQKLPESSTLPLKGKQKEVLRPDLQFAPLVRAALAVAEREALIEHAETLANDLEVSVEWIFQMALVEFIERQGGDTKGYTDRLRRVTPYWQIHEYTTEELDALLEADKFTPEDAELYKDLLED